MKLKKILAMTLTMAMVVLSFAGCGKEESYLSFDELYSNLTSSIDFSASNMQKQGEAAPAQKARLFVFPVSFPNRSPLPMPRQAK